MKADFTAAPIYLHIHIKVKGLLPPERISRRGWVPNAASTSGKRSGVRKAEHLILEGSRFHLQQNIRHH